MFARSIATLVWAMGCAACFGGAAPAASENHSVVVYVKAGPDQPKEPVEQMERGASAILEAAGYTLEWRNLSSESSQAIDANVAVVELHGVCRAPQRGAGLRPLDERSILASTAVSDGEILPFSWLECETLSRMLAEPLSKNLGERDFLYGRAMGRVIAHELYHVLTKSRHHDGNGVAKEGFTAQDVLADRFVFDAPTLARMRAPAGDDGDSTADDGEDSGR